jgi:hypothetical protein
MPLPDLFKAFRQDSSSAEDDAGESDWRLPEDPFAASERVPSHFVQPAKRASPRTVSHPGPRPTNEDIATGLRREMEGWLTAVRHMEEQRDGTCQLSKTHFHFLLTHLCAASHRESESSYQSGPLHFMHGASDFYQNSHATRSFTSMPTTPQSFDSHATDRSPPLGPSIVPSRPSQDWVMLQHHLRRSAQSDRDDIASAYELRTRSRPDTAPNGRSPLRNRLKKARRLATK